MIGIIIATLIVGGVGLLIGILLGIAGEKFKVQTNEKEENILGLLPGNNCGGCGYAGCAALAKAIADGQAPANGCPVGGEKTANEIAAVLGVEVENVKKVAFVKCAGDCESTKDRYEYSGNLSCREAVYLAGGNKSCKYGCLGYGSCVTACEFGAISIVKGIAKINEELCVACGKCVKTCPKGLIELVPYESEIRVACSSKDKGKEVMAACKKGCIACKMCEKVCESEAITVKDNIAHIDYSKCTKCKKCAEKCPKKIITISEKESEE